MAKVKSITCEHCGKSHKDLTLFVCQACGYPISVTYDYEEIASMITKDSLECADSPGVWQYRKLLPEISTVNQITLGEGRTPLIRFRRLQEELGLHRLYAKLDCLNPTGSFKDRGSAVGVSMALERGFRSVGCTSSGNMAASVSAYGAKAGLKSVIFVPPHTPKEKLIQTCSYGAKVVGTGSMSSEDRYRLTHEIGLKNRILMINNNSPLRLEGQKTFAFEVWKEFAPQVPDWIVIPTSSGGNTYAIIKGFTELKQLGLAERVPRILVAQSSGCAPIVKAFKEGRTTVEKWDNPESVASAILNPLPPSGERILKALTKDGGGAEMADSNEIIQAFRDLAGKEGVFCEPSSAVGLAALKKATAAGTITKDDSVVLDITGVGFKDLRVASELCSPPMDIAKWTNGRP